MRTRASTPQRRMMRLPGADAALDDVETIDIDFDALSRHRRMSLPFLFIWVLLMLFGLLMMFSASFGESFVSSTSYVRVSDDEAVLESLPETLQTQVIADATATAKRQLKITGVGTVFALILALSIHFRRWLYPWIRKAVYWIVTGSLAYTWLFGETYQGAQRWIEIGPISVQTSELAKIGAVFYLSSHFFHQKRKWERPASDPVPWDKKRASTHRGAREVFHYFTRPFLAMLLWFGLILMQPHLSGAVILTVLCALMFLMGQIPLSVWRRGLLQVIPIVLVLVLLLSLAWPAFKGESLPDYLAGHFAHSQKRIDMFRDRESVDSDVSRQIVQSEVAFGTGGLTGVGLGRSVQKLNWLSEAHNDFIFPIIGEELGLIGTLAVLILFMVFLGLGLGIAARADTLAARNMAAGFTFLIVFQAFLNMAVSTSLIPATGISLPFFSSGGSANVIFALAAAIVLSISKSGVRQDPQLVKILDRPKRTSPRRRPRQARGDAR